MLYRKIESFIHDYFTSESDKILVITGARQIGKSFIIRHVANKVYKNVLEINLIDDYEGDRVFESIRSTEDFYLALSSFGSEKLGSYEDTMIFLDEIQKYPHLLTMLKFLREEKRYHFVASGSLLGIALKTTTSVPAGSIVLKRMYPLDLEEFMIANGCGNDLLDAVRINFENLKPMPEGIHNRLMSLFKRYLLVGGLPDAVNEFLASRNIGRIRSVQNSVHALYAVDVTQYDEEHRLKIARIYDMVPSNMENKKKRIVYKDIEDNPAKRGEDYVEEIDYLIASGICLEVKAVTNPSFPLPESGRKNLLKLYLNDVGILTSILYRNNVNAILGDENSVNLGSVYECAVAMELAAHENSLYYYDNKKNGEVDYIIDDYKTLSSVPLEIKSGKDYSVHSALNRLVDNKDYRVKTAYVLSNEREVRRKGPICYIPIYYIMCFDGNGGDPDQML